MLRNRVFVISAAMLGLIVALEIAGWLVGQRLESAFRQSQRWATEAGLNLEFDAFAIRAAGEGASAFLAGSDKFATEAFEALEAAQGRLDALKRRDRSEDALRDFALPLREIQERVVQMLGDSLRPLTGPDRLTDGGMLERAEAVYSYESLLTDLRSRSAAFERVSLERANADVDRWRTIADVLGVGRVLALAMLVIWLARSLHRSVVRPVGELSDAAKRMRDGKFSVRVDAGEHDEIGALQDAFNAMAERLGNYHDDSERREAQLKEALEAARAANQSKSTFVASISHELRTPLHGVLGAADLLLMGELNAEQRSRVKTVRGSAESLLLIINDVLDVSRLEAGRMEIHFTPLALRPQVQETMAIVTSRADRQDLDFRCDIADEVPEWVFGDAGRLRQILTNLLGNAVKFTNEGFVELKIACEAGDSHRVRFTVTDSGKGIEAEAIERIFYPFEQADGSISRSHGGTGLGLTICRLLVEAMGGEIHVESEAGKGARFWFSLPLPECDSPPQLRTVPVPTGEGFSGCVLVAEDHPVNQAVAEAMLEELGCEFDLVGNGREALTALDQRQYDLVLMDCQMPELDGYEATRLLRERECDGRGGEANPRRTVVVAMTAGAMSADRDAAQAAGMDDFLAKPFTVNDLRLVLSRWLVAR